MIIVMYVKKTKKVEIVHTYYLQSSLYKLKSSAPICEVEIIFVLQLQYLGYKKTQTPHER